MNATQKQQRPTPETDAFWLQIDDSEFDTTQIVNKLKQFERERDEARETCQELVTDSNSATLAQTVVRLERERNEVRECCDKQAEMLDRQAKCNAELSEALSGRTVSCSQCNAAAKERDQLSRDLSSLLAADCLNGHDAIEGVQNGLAMREAIKEASAVLEQCAEHPMRRDFSDSANFTLAKLQPFITPP